MQRWADHPSAWLQTSWQVAVQLLLVAVTAAVSLGVLPFMYFGAHWYLTQSAGGSQAVGEPGSREDAQAGQKRGKQTVLVNMMPCDVQTDKVGASAVNISRLSAVLCRCLAAVVKPQQAGSTVLVVAARAAVSAGQACQGCTPCQPALLCCLW